MADGGKILSLGRMSGSNFGKMSINFGSQKSLPLRNSNYAKSRSYWRHSVRAVKIYKSQNLQKSRGKILTKQSDKEAGRRVRHTRGVKFSPKRSAKHA